MPKERSSSMNGKAAGPGFERFLSVLKNVMIRNGRLTAESTNAKESGGEGVNEKKDAEPSSGVNGEPEAAVNSQQPVLLMEQQLPDGSSIKYELVGNKCVMHFNVAKDIDDKDQAGKEVNGMLQNGLETLKNAQVRPHGMKQHQGNSK